MINFCYLNKLGCKPFKDVNEMVKDDAFNPLNSTIPSLILSDSMRCNAIEQKYNADVFTIGKSDYQYNNYTKKHCNKLPTRITSFNSSYLNNVKFTNIYCDYSFLKKDILTESFYSSILIQLVKESKFDYDYNHNDCGNVVIPLTKNNLKFISRHEKIIFKLFTIQYIVITQHKNNMLYLSDKDHHYHFHIIGN